MTPNNHNPYLPPESDIQDVAQPLSLFDSGSFVPRGRDLPARNGIRWCRDAWLMFAPQWWRWFAMLLVYVLINMLPGILFFFIEAGSVRFLIACSQIVMQLLMVGGIVLASEDLVRNGQLNIQLIFAGFRRRVGDQFRFGLRYIGILVALTVGFMLFVFFAGRMVSIGRVGASDPSLILGNPLGAAFFSCIGIMVVIIAMQILLFGQTLLMLHGLSPGDAIFCARHGSWRNIKASMTGFLLVFAPAVALTLLLIVFPASAFQTIFGLGASDLIASASPVPHVIGGYLMQLAAIPLMTLVFTSSYAAYRDIYFDDAKYADVAQAA